MTNNNGSGHKGTLVALGLIIGAAGAYFLYGTKKGAKKREEIKGWMLKMKGEVLERMENMKDVSEETYQAIIEKVAETYRGVASIDKEELEDLVDDLKKHWKNIVKQASKKPRRVRSKEE